MMRGGYNDPYMLRGNWTLDTLPPAAGYGAMFAYVTDGPGGAALYWSNGANWIIPPLGSVVQGKNLTTAADGTVTWTYDTPYAVPPAVVGVASYAAGSADIINVQLDGAPTASSAKFRVTRTQQSVVALLGLTILSVPAGSLANIVIHALAKVIG